MAELFWNGLIICLPVLSVIMIVGITVSVLQAITQVQETTLTFVPKLVATAITLVVCGPWMLRKLTQYSAQLWSGIPSLF
jgi:flagellar biosynthetic protein FliQ